MRGSVGGQGHGPSLRLKNLGYARRQMARARARPIAASHYRAEQARHLQHLARRSQRLHAAGPFAPGIPPKRRPSSPVSHTPPFGVTPHSPAGAGLCPLFFCARGRLLRQTFRGHPRLRGVLFPPWRLLAARRGQGLYSEANDAIGRACAFSFRRFSSFREIKSWHPVALPPGVREQVRLRAQVPQAPARKRRRAASATGPDVPPPMNWNAARAL